MAAMFTTADRDAVKTALITAATTGHASVTIAGQNVQTYTLDELRRLLEYILEDLATDDADEDGHSPFFVKQLIPGGTG